MTCPDCNGQTQPTFEGEQRWCANCGRLFWMNRDGTVRATYVPAWVNKLQARIDIHAANVESGRSHQ